MFKGNADIGEFAGALFALIKKEVWAGGLDFVPDPMDKQEYAVLIRSAYESGATGFDAKNLWALSKWAKDEVEAMLDGLKEVFSEIT